MRPPPPVVAIATLVVAILAAGVAAAVLIRSHRSPAARSPEADPMDDERACMDRSADPRRALDACVRAVRAPSLERDRTKLHDRLTELVKVLSPDSGPQSAAPIAAAGLYWFLTDAEDGCTCRADLWEVTRAFQEAHNTDPLGKGPRSPTPATGPIPTDGYLEASTAKALALYSGHWLAPCYGSFNAGCGEVPGQDASTTPPAEVDAASGRPKSGGGCRAVDFGEPDGGVSCTEVVLMSSDAAPNAADDEKIARLEAQARAGCGTPQVARLIPDWVFDPRGCPKGRIAGCSATDRSDPRVARVEWFYDRAGTVDDIRGRCRKSNRMLVMP